MLLNRRFDGMVFRLSRKFPEMRTKALTRSRLY